MDDDYSYIFGKYSFTEFKEVVLKVYARCLYAMIPIATIDEITNQLKIQ